MFWVIYLTETDGEIMMWACNTMKEVDDHVKVIGLGETDYAIMKGIRVKNFERVCGQKKEKL
jgi:hypothetical protein